MLVDTHCHLSNDEYEDLDKIIEDDFKEVDKIIISGCNKKDILESIEIAEKYENIFVTIGYHPDQVGNVSDEDLSFLEEKCSHNKVVGIGEIGLDYHYVDDNHDEQIALFEKQLKLAEKLNMPVVIHSRDATKDTIDALKKYNVRGVIHAFSGSVETANIYISMGFLLGIGGVVTFKNSKLFEVVKAVGIEHIVLETDSPYLTPHPFRGLQNSSKYIPIIARRVSEVTEKSYEEVSLITGDNAIKMFDLI